MNLLDSKYAHQKENRRIFDYLQYDLNNKLYYFGNHFLNPAERKIYLFDKIYYNLKLFLIKLIVKFRSVKTISSKRKVVISTAYFNLDNKFGDSDYIISRSPWKFGKQQPIVDFKLFTLATRINETLSRGNFNDLLEKSFEYRVTEFIIQYKKFIKNSNIKALFLPMDIGFFEKLSIDLFKEMNLPTFNFIHGLPGIYNIYDYNRTDYLVVWGEAIKQNFINVGYDPDKIIVSGHPQYDFLELKELRFDYTEILVVSKSLNGSQYTDEVVLGDRSNLIFYLYSIQNTLQNLGVKKVRLRLHPSENPIWYKMHIDTTFFEIDEELLSDSLSKSTLVIGGVSTLFIESLIYGVNYIVFEPLFDDRTASGFKLVPPFCKGNSKVPVAINEDELSEILLNKIKVDASILADYLGPKFSISEILAKIND